jgi:N-methylhydantoinase B/oxoprolinase/acetone carboxylase alpha subunit
VTGHVNPKLLAASLSGPVPALVEFKHGDVLVKHSAGGGGVGSPLDRSPDAVRRDVRNELVSLEAARDVYGVVLDPATLEIDPSETDALRSRLRAQA